MKKSILWLRKDLRLHDNPALNSALTHGQTVAVYIKEPSNTKTEARDWWLHHSLISLEKSLKEKNIPLVFMQGNALDLLPKFMEEQNADHLFWNRRYTPEGIETDTQIKEQCAATSCMGNLLIEPWDIKNKTGGFYKVFSPMWKDLQTRDIPKPCALAKNAQEWANIHSKYTCTLDEFKLIDTTKTWHHAFAEKWTVGEPAALEKLKNFLEDKVESYKDSRDFPIKEATSELSPHLHFGEISPREIWAQTEAFEHANNLVGNTQIHHFKSEVVWREFSYQILFNYKQIDTQPIKENFAQFPWAESEKTLTSWQRGRTGIPIVDAGMRELWHTGTMHNRVRMIVASFLTKNLLVPWQEGAKWFMDTLVDADEAANSASWQWVAGCGLDAAPYFRIFNPVSQGEKFDADGAYVKKWVPELAKLDKSYIHKPWEAPSFDLQLAGLTLGKTYPNPLVDLKKTRARALEAYQEIK